MFSHGKYQSLPGDRDPSYASAGRLTLAEDIGTPVILLILSDGSSIISSYTSTGPRLAKVTADGEMESRFGEQGVAKLRFAYPGHENGEAWIFGVLEIKDEGVPKLLLLLSIPAPHKRTFAVARLQETGALDLTFGSGGKGYEIYADFINGATGQPEFAAATTATGGESRYNRGGRFGAAVQVDDNKTLVAFNLNGANNSTPQSWFFRLHPDGKLDEMFGDLGIQEFEHPGGFAQIAALTPGRDGKIVAAGHCFLPSDENGAGFVARFLSKDASVDESFGDQQVNFPGFYQTPDSMEPGTGSSFLREVSVDSLSGDITSIGYQDKDDSSVGIVVRLSHDGTFDPSFNGGVLLKVEERDGMVFHTFASEVSADGLIYIAGERSGIQRRLKSGDIDPAFGQGGYMIYPDVFTIVELARQPDGKLLMLSVEQNSYIDRLMV